MSKTDLIRAQTERIDALMDIVKYMNSIQDGQTIEIDEGHTKTTIIEAKRELNGHEEDVYNAALINLKKVLGFK